MRSNQYRSSDVRRSTCRSTLNYILRVTDFDTKEPFPRSEFTPSSIWTYWMLIDRQRQSQFMPELHGWISKLTFRHLQILHQEIF